MQLIRIVHVCHNSSILYESIMVIESHTVLVYSSLFVRMQLLYQLLMKHPTGLPEEEYVPLLNAVSSILVDSKKVYDNIQYSTCKFYSTSFLCAILLSCMIM